MDDSELFTIMRVCAHNLHRMSDGRAGQRRLIGILSENDGIAQRDLQDIVVVRSGSLSEVLGKLEDAGLIERRASAEDRRRVCVFLTPEGRRQAHDARDGRTDAISQAFSCFDDREKQTLGALVSRLNAHFESTRPAEREEEHHQRHHGECRHGKHHHDRE